MSYIHPVHALLLAFPVPLFWGTLAADIAYARTAEIQWSNFAQWLNAGGLLFGGFALLAAGLCLLRGWRGGARRQRALHGGLLLAAWITGLINAFIHARDAYGMIPDALWWSGVAAVLALLASWTAWRGFATEEIR